MTSIMGNFIIETDVTDLPHGRALVTMRATRLIETGLPLSEDEQAQLRDIAEFSDDIARMHGATAVRP